MPGRLALTTLSAALVACLAADLFVVVAAGRTTELRNRDLRRELRDDPELPDLPGLRDPGAGPRPQPGVYRYATTGWSEVNRLGQRREYPATTHRVVRLGRGCRWQEEVVVLDEHRETYDVCATPGGPRDVAFGTDLVYFTVHSTSAALCDGAAPRTGLQTGETVMFRCLDRPGKTAVEGTVEGLGPAELAVSGRPTTCERIRIITVMTGRTTGSATRTLCVHPLTGLVIREERVVALRAPSRWLGTVDYREEAVFALLDGVPRAAG